MLSKELPKFPEGKRRWELEEVSKKRTPHRDCAEQENKQNTGINCQRKRNFHPRSPSERGGTSFYRLLGAGLGPSAAQGMDRMTQRPSCNDGPRGPGFLWRREGTFSTDWRAIAVSAVPVTGYFRVICWGSSDGVALCRPPVNIRQGPWSPNLFGPIEFLVALQIWGRVQRSPGEFCGSGRNGGSI